MRYDVHSRHALIYKTHILKKYVNAFFKYTITIVNILISKANLNILENIDDDCDFIFIVSGKCQNLIII